LKLFKKFLFISVLIGMLTLIVTPSFAKSVYVRGYFRKDGTYVSPYYRSAPDKSLYNNWSFSGNVNPYTGKFDSRNYYSWDRSYSS